MIRSHSILALLTLSAALSGALSAQTPSPASAVATSSPAATPGAAKGASPGETQTKGPTEITATQEATFDEKTRVAVFTGSVHVNDPQFIMDCDKLTAYLKKPDEEAKPGEKPTPKPAATAAASPGASAAPKPQQGGLERAVGEGHVVLVQDKPGAPGEEPTHYVGRSERCEYEAATGDMKLIGNPSVQQGVNTHVSLDPTTVMILNRAGQMRTYGRSKTLIQDQSTITPEKSPHP